MTRRHLYLLSLLAPAALYAASPYINKVYEFRPAPGQFVNELPEYESGDTYADMLAKAQDALAFDKQPGAVSLGAFGGYVVFGFDHTIVNTPGAYDFKIYGNAIISDINNGGGSCEPGIVYVSRDENGNGLPDDPWYELAGSEHTNPATVSNFSVTYKRPAAGHTANPDPSNKHITDMHYIPWNASDGTSGHLQANDYHTQPYWPEWLADEELTFTGVRLPNNAADINGDGSYILLKMLPWGYADNCPNSSFEGFKIDWAVDADGNPALLSGIDFVKVVTGLHQQCGALGESSTEVCGAEDLHPEATSVESIYAEEPLRATARGGVLTVVNPAAATEAILFNMQGAQAAVLEVPSGRSTHALPALPSGIYLLTFLGQPAVKIAL